ncbi:MAG: replication factor C small subunit [Nanoarchaeota archaeon]
MEHSIWIEKYRPKTFDEIKGQDKIIARIRAFVKSGNMPHLLFSGPAGIGKTTTALVIARELYGDEWQNNFLELNASDERGIDVVRVKVKDFARTRAIGDVPFKVIYLDECDALTRDAQQALRRTMENYTQTTRFILSCNYSSKIIDPIQSRCTVFRFQPLAKEDVYEIIERVAARESLTVTDSAKDAIYHVSGGDCRRAENILQSCASIQKDIDEELIYSLSSAAKPTEIREILALALKKDFHGARKLLLDTMLKHGLSGIDIIKQIQPEVWKLDVPDRVKIRLVDRCGEVEFRMTEGSDEYVQLEALLAYFMLASN